MRFITGRYFVLNCVMILCSVVAVAQQATDSMQNSLLWRISGNGLTKSSYLFGTTHLVCKADLNTLLPATLKKTIISADEAIFEVYEADPNVLAQQSMQYNMMTGGITLDSLLSPQESDTVNNYFETHPMRGLILPLAKKMKPVLLLGMIGARQSFVCEGDKTSSMEEELQYLAKLFYKPCSGFSSYKEQMGYLDSVPYRDQAVMLLRAMGKMNANPATTVSENSIQNMYELYKQQKAAQLYRIIEGETKPDDPWLKFTRNARNNLWVPRLEAKMKQGSVFVAIGFAHIPGKNGLIQLLRNKGYIVEQISNN
ncbi:TraB/GumN family protein [Chitinophaga eiseniae]|uniref:TraB/GumN family protein n=1 Tax=Chitinophaga eiseniae TaxID=634771 RepID=A0A847SDZ3_9BACT|nr:TraB/GumN family protein [Chitinophaga eiseniae]NLR78404.1 TraB/GumN family protein [Chitinophaga eiseniae]